MVAGPGERLSPLGFRVLTFLQAEKVDHQAVMT